MAWNLNPQVHHTLVITVGCTQHSTLYMGRVIYNSLCKKPKFMGTVQFVNEQNTISFSFFVSWLGNSVLSLIDNPIGITFNLLSLSIFNQFEY